LAGTEAIPGVLTCSSPDGWRWKTIDSSVYPDQV
jgi:hypothetical protein